MKNLLVEPPCLCYQTSILYYGMLQKGRSSTTTDRAPLSRSQIAIVITRVLSIKSRLDTELAPSQTFSSSWTPKIPKSLCRSPKHRSALKNHTFCTNRHPGESSLVKDRSRCRADRPRAEEGGREYDRGPGAASAHATVLLLDRCTTRYVGPGEGGSLNLVPFEESQKSNLESSKLTPPRRLPPHLAQLGRRLHNAEPQCPRNPRREGLRALLHRVAHIQRAAADRRWRVPELQVARPVPRLEGAHGCAAVLRARGHES